MEQISILEGRHKQVFEKKTGGEQVEISCDTSSLSGSVSQRACVFCGSRVVLYPVADALHLVMVQSDVPPIRGTSGGLSLQALNCTG
jgi:nitrogenase molybdenum-cofactor synthesis protein NifE